MTDPDLLDLAAGLARRAAAAIEAVKRAGFAVEHKTDESPVTEADRIAEALIVEALRQSTPDIPVVAEEEVAAGIATAAAARFWLVDPLDGTRDFAKGRDEYAVCIGLVEHGRAILGAIALPATGEVFAGLLGQGAWKEDAAPRRRIRVRAVPPQGLTVLASRTYAEDPRMAPFLAGRPIAERRAVSSALKFCRVAEGVADLYPRFGGTMEWDTAAGQAIVEAAGGAVTLPDGSPLRYGKAGWRNPDFVCRGGPQGEVTA
ncbi:3'(2'),5'-bisphosphate nucleotidase CysQ [Paracraurococcus ruber]|uniref:3'(2'),5'-bisphosphate nucleotidase CysQ n=1 Tax=Paracraurococcus ruber TaxID=77675 RepID=A0ABS1D7X5_9PROT|nr:3'(2'),5'-bisphosphate nucleotidase CysQ [Paracraurococcus ruber]MBK1662162.1 3'(2'),5'-bisphosphate nucleotidase [Paracraurococcus ruber]